MVLLIGEDKSLFIEFSAALAKALYESVGGEYFVAGCCSLLAGVFHQVEFVVFHDGLGSD